MESADQNSPKARFRFGFSGKRKRARSPDDMQSLTVSSDDILDSLTRQAATQVGAGSEREEGIDVLTETEEPGPLSEPTISTLEGLKLETNRHLGHFAIVLMCLGGLLVVWLYSSGRNIFDVSQLDILVQKTGVQSVFANPVQIAVVSLFAMVIALWVAHRRRTSRFRIPI